VQNDGPCWEKGAPFEHMKELYVGTVCQMHDIRARPELNGKQVLVLDVRPVKMDGSMVLVGMVDHPELGLPKPHWVPLFKLRNVRRDFQFRQEPLPCREPLLGLCELLPVGVKRSQLGDDGAQCPQGQAAAPEPAQRGAAVGAQEQCEPEYFFN
jgi:hypothetical protein